MSIASMAHVLQTVFLRLKRWKSSGEQERERERRKKDIYYDNNTCTTQKSRWQEPIVLANKRRWQKNMYTTQKSSPSLSLSLFMQAQFDFIFDLSFKMRLVFTQGKCSSNLDIETFSHSTTKRKKLQRHRFFTLCLFRFFILFCSPHWSVCCWRKREFAHVFSI